MAVAFDAFTEFTFSGVDPAELDHTPSGTPRGIIALIMINASSSDRVVGVTYGGVEMARVRSDLDSANEFMRTWAYFLGSSIPTGTQTLSVDMISSVSEGEIICVSVTADGDTEVQDHDGVSDNTANPSVTLSYGGKTCIAFGIIGSGQASLGSVALPAGGVMTAMQSFDFGQQVVRADRQSSPGTSDFNYNYVVATDDVAMSVVAITEAAPPPDRHGGMVRGTSALQAVQRAATWMRRHDGLLVPERRLWRPA